MGKDLIVNYKNEPCYEIKIRNDFSDLSKSIQMMNEKNYLRICIVTDSVIEPLYLKNVILKLSVDYPDTYITSFVFDAGESSKNLSTVQKLYQKLIQDQFDRNDLLIALGGGVVGDLTGFTAATYLRGIDFVQVPTTLLSQVDSSVGGKTGVDFEQYKNMVGAFYMPCLVYINTDVLKTLPAEQISSGMAEVIKYGIIRDFEFYEWLDSNVDKVKSLDQETLEYLIYQSCKNKKEVVEEDPTEQGIRATLNFGHTIGHAIEKLSHFKLYHGQCVGLGMVAAAYISMKRDIVTEGEFFTIMNILDSYNVYPELKDINIEDVISATKHDKKMNGQQIHFVLIRGIGISYIDTTVTDQEMRDAVEYILSI